MLNPRRFMNAKAANNFFHAVGNPVLTGSQKSMTRQQFIRRGKRRVGIAGGVLGVNAMIGPSGNRSSGGRGYTQPRSMGGYA